MNVIASQLATIPPPPFRNIEIGALTLHGYGLVMGIAIIVAMMVAEWGLRRQHVDPSRFTGFAMVCVAVGFVGARLYHVASEPSHFAQHPADIIKVWEGGLGIYGGIIGGAAFGIWQGPRFGFPRRVLADAVAPAFLFAQAIGRLGNYLNQELYGRPFDGAWALRVERPFRSPSYADVATYHPTFLYEAVGTATLGGIFVLLLARWRTRTPGILLALYLAAYSTVRVIVEPVRIDDTHHWLDVRQNVWVAGTLVVVGLAAAAVMYVRDPARRAR